MKIGLLRRIILVVEEKVLAVMGQERLHDVIVVPLNGDRPRVAERGST